MLTALRLSPGNGSGIRCTPGATSWAPGRSHACRSASSTISARYDTVPAGGPRESGVTTSRRLLEGREPHCRKRLRSTDTGRAMKTTRDATPEPPETTAAPRRRMARFDLSATQLIATALAAITATIAASYLGVSG